MDDTLVQAYFDIFNIPSEDFTLERVKRISKETSVLDGDTIYKFIGILTSFSPLLNYTPDKNEMIALRNKATSKYKEIKINSYIREINWKIWSKKKKKEITKTYQFGCQIDPQHILDFEIVDGIYYIKVELYGIFY